MHSFDDVILGPWLPEASLTPNRRSRSPSLLWFECQLVPWSRRSQEFLSRFCFDNTHRTFSRILQPQIAVRELDKFRPTLKQCVLDRFINS